MADTNLKVWLSTLRQKGNLAYEYNPLHNYQTDVDLYLIDDKYVVPKGQAVNLSNGDLLNKKRKYDKSISNWIDVWVDKRGNIIKQDFVLAESGILWARAGSVIDFDTD